MGDSRDCDFKSYSLHDAPQYFTAEILFLPPSSSNKPKRGREEGSQDAQRAENINKYKKISFSQLFTYESSAESC